MDKNQFDVLFSSVHREGWAQDPSELWQVVEQVQKIRPKTILEIGVQGGQSLSIWDAILEEGGHLYGMDLVETAKQSLYKNPLTFIIGRSESPEVIAHTKELITEVDFLFIDGEHVGENPRLDWENYSPLVRKGGIVGFHDIKIADVKKVFDAISQTKQSFLGQFGTGLVFI